MRRPLLLVLIALGACVGGGLATGDSDQAANRLPSALEDLTLLEEHPSISSVAFPHGAHTDPGVTGAPVSCVTCHHELEDEPARIPQRCTSCHEYAYLTEPIDEDEPHDHDLPPDL